MYHHADTIIKFCITRAVENELKKKIPDQNLRKKTQDTLVDAIVVDTDHMI